VNGERKSLAGVNRPQDLALERKGHLEAEVEGHRRLVGEGHLQTGRYSHIEGFGILRSVC
jgi:hypothetical protein